MKIVEITSLSFLCKSETWRADVTRVALLGRVTLRDC
jgi:hypothetical protein